MSSLLHISKLSKSFGPHIIFDEADFRVNKKQKIGVIGRNGAGKTTLFRMILGQEKADSGEIATFDDTRIGYLEQENKFNANESVMDFLLRSSRKESWECAKIAGKFQLKNELLDKRIVELSGGYQMRVRLSAMLLKDPNLLLLDEPTNHLDLRTLLLLEEFLKTYNGSYLIISHDREFLRNTCDRTLEVDQGKLYSFPCSLDAYLAFKAEKQKSDERYNKKIRQEQKHLQAFVDRFRYKASKATQAQSKLKQIDRLSEIKIRQSLKTAQIVIPPIADRKGLAIRIDKLEIGYPGKPIAGNITLDIERGRHLAILGDNGQGKTTFLKTLNGELEKLSGNFRWMPHIKIGNYAQHVTTTLDPKEQIGQYLERQAGSNVSSEDILRIAANFLFYGDDIKKSISVLSGGEKARLCLAGLLLNECNVLLLDEPTNHLDFETVEMLAQALHQSRATILFISHNRDFIRSLAEDIIEVDNGKVKLTGFDYDDYLHHLYLKSEIDDGKNKKAGADPEADKAAEKEKRAAAREKRKELKKEATRLERSIEYNKATEQKLFKEYEADQYRFSRDRDIAMKRVKELISEEELMLLEIEEEIEKLIE